MNPFDDSEDEHVRQVPVNDGNDGSDDGDVDPLDAFMSNLEGKEECSPKRMRIRSDTGFENDDDDETPVEMMERVIRSRDGAVKDFSGSEDESNHAKRSIDSLPAVDHSAVDYPAFRKDFYQEHASIVLLSHGEVSELRKALGVTVSGSQIPKCVCSFGHLNLPDPILSVIRYLEFSTPTAIQSQAIPCALSGRDLIGIAMTGSGKTLAYVIPAIVHVMNNVATGAPRVAIVCPTRELAIQIEQEIYRFAKKGKDKFSSIALTGGLSKYEQFKQLVKGCDVVVGNPGRMIDLIQMKRGLDLGGVSMCVLDEADRMFKMGFESQVRAIVQRMRPDRQMPMFSATMPPRIEKLAREVLNDPIRVVVGAIGQAANVIDQNVFICHSEEEKFVWMSATIPALLAGGDRTLIFVNSKTTGEELLRRINSFTPAGVGSIHGDLDQTERMRLMNEFRSGKCPLLIATDVAARGIDVHGIACVIEFDAARDFDTHTHRIGRTGRAGVPGISWTLVSDTDSKIAAHIVESIEALGMKNVPPDLLALAMKHAPFRASRTIESPPHKQRPPSEDPASWESLASHFKQGASESLS